MKRARTTRTPSRKQHRTADALARFISEAKAMLPGVNAPGKKDRDASSPFRIVGKDVPLSLRAVYTIELARQGDREAVTELAATLQTIASGLQSLANHGDEYAAAALAKIVSGTVGEMERNAQAFGEIPQRYTTWPVLASPHPDRVKQVAAHVKKIGVGRRAALNVFRKWRTMNTDGQPFNEVIHDTVTAMMELIQFARSQNRIWNFQSLQDCPKWIAAAARLRDDSPATDYFEAGWLALLEFTESHPERNQSLRVIGEHRAGEKERGQPNSRTLSSNIRQRIRERLSQAFALRYHK